MRPVGSRAIRDLLQNGKRRLAWRQPVRTADPHSTPGRRLRGLRYAGGRGRTCPRHDRRSLSGRKCYTRYDSSHLADAELREYGRDAGKCGPRACVPRRESDQKLHCGRRPEKHHDNSERQASRAGAAKFKPLLDKEVGFHGTQALLERADSYVKEGIELGLPESDAKREYARGARSARCSRQGRRGISVHQEEIQALPTPRGLVDDPGPDHR